MNFLTVRLVFLACLANVIYSEEVLVQVNQGWLFGKVAQSVVNSSVSYYSFKGIPYAKPPVGPLRFKDPQPPESWEGVLNATEHRNICPQVTQDEYATVEGDEDCLFLNVYTPNLSPNANMSVLVLIHGGSFRFGSGNDESFGPDMFVNNKDIVLVTINYRVESLGYLSFENADVPGNAGFKDQVFALRWVRDNIKYFGGNPDSVTLQGQSSGAAAVSLHVVSPMSTGLFHRAMIFSGSGLCDWAQTYYAKYRAFALAQDIGLFTRNATAAIEYLRNQTFDKLINTATSVVTSETMTRYPTRFIPFAFVVEEDFGQERFMTMTPLEALEQGFINVKEVVIGYTNREAVAMTEYNEAYMSVWSRYPEMYVPRLVVDATNTTAMLDLGEKIRYFYFGDKLMNTTNMEEYVNLSSNVSFIYSTHRFMNRIPSNVTVYSYKFAFDSKWNYYIDIGSAYNFTGAAHTDDLIYLWYPNWMNRTLKENTLEYELIMMYTELCANFVKYGNPTPDDSLLGFTWTPFDVETRSYLYAENTPFMDTWADKEDVVFWAKIYEEAGLIF